MVAEEILKQVNKCEVYFPVHDKGIDLLVVNGSRHCGIQVKESRYYWERRHSWHQVKQKNLGIESSSNIAFPDMFVFLTYVPVTGTAKISSFEQSHIIIPFEKLRVKTKNKRPSRGVYSFYFSIEREGVWEKRDGRVDYSAFLNNWSLVAKVLSGP